MSCNEWKECCLGDISNMKYGKMPKKDKIRENGYPIFSGYRITGYYDEYMLEKPELIIVARGVGATGDVKLSPAKSYITNLSIILLINENIVDKKFLYYKLKNENLRSLDSGSAQSQITINDLSKYKINIPILKEQVKIGEMLSSLDKKIELNNEINKTLEEIAQALFKRWFVDFEFPNEDGKPYKSSGGEMVDSELGMIPKDWRCGNFNDISEKIYSGGTPKTSEESYWNGELSWMSSGETRNNFVTYTEKSITGLGAEKSSTKLANKYDTVIASAGQGFTRGQTSLLLIDTYVNQSLIVVKSNENFRLFNYINIKMRYNELRAISDSHSIRGSLTTKMISTLNTIIPTNEVLAKFNKVIESIISNIENNIINTNELIELRDSLLPKLMSGEIRVEDIEANL